MDRETWHRAQLGEREALNALGSWLVEVLHAFLSRYGGTEDVRELTQKTMLEILIKLDEAPDEVGTLRAWVCGFATNILRRVGTDRGREQAREAKLLVHLLEQGLEPGADLEAEFGEHEMWELLDKQIEALAPSYQSVLALRRKNHSFASIAAQMKIAEGTARRYLWLAIRQLRQAIERERVTRSTFRSSDIAS